MNPSITLVVPEGADESPSQSLCGFAFDTGLRLGCLASEYDAVRRLAMGSIYWAKHEPKCARAASLANNCDCGLTEWALQAASIPKAAEVLP